MGTVYRAHDRLLGRAVAVKVISRGGDPMSLQRFLREVEVMAEIDHPAVVRSFHVDVSEDGHLFQAQELVDGEALDRVQSRRRVLPPEHVASIGSVLAEALAAAHALGVVHRDVKPSNVILTGAAPGLKLLDFGISKLRAHGDAPHTRTGAVVGTPAFMAPEQTAEPESASEAVDVYALGVTLLLLLTGRLLVPGALASTFLSDAGVSGPLADAVRQCLGGDPRSRPSADQLRVRLAALAGPPLDLAKRNQGVLHEAPATPSTRDV
jgi:serine/threonine protein kinase